MTDDESLAILVLFMREVVDHGLGSGIFVPEKAVMHMILALMKGEAVSLGLEGSEIKCLSNTTDFDNGRARLLGSQEKKVHECNMSLA